jgi:hypothetical protein
LDQKEERIRSADEPLIRQRVKKEKKTRAKGGRKKDDDDDEAVLLLAKSGAGKTCRKFYSLARQKFPRSSVTDSILRTSSSPVKSQKSAPASHPLKQGPIQRDHKCIISMKRRKRDEPNLTNGPITLDQSPTAALQIPPPHSRPHKSDQKHEMNASKRQPIWLILAIASGACAAFNGVFAKL